VCSSDLIVHGSHDRGKLCSRWAIEIEAGRAFGTAHHGTTKGCLMAIEMLARIGNPGTVLDIGTGSGVLAIAAAKAFCHSARVSAIDIDPVAVEIARKNCRKNGVVSSVSVFVGDGTRQTYACRAKPFGLLMANILAKPLLRLAPSLSGLTKRGGFLVLSGLLADQGREVLARYRETGFCLMCRIELEGWATLMLKRTR
jgi:ribosomal protein L11 methyltransferase